MLKKPDVLFILASFVILGALLTGLMTPDKTQAATVLNESLIR